MSQQSAKEKAEAYVREQLPELMRLSFGLPIKYQGKEGILCTVGHGLARWNIHLIGNASARNVDVRMCEIIGHPIQLQHWLRVLPGYCLVDNDGTCRKTGKSMLFTFNLTTGQPATEEDYQAFCEIVGV